MQLGKDAGKIADIVKGADNIGDALDGARTASNVADGVKATGNTLDATKSVDNVADAVKQTPTFGGCFTADTRIKTKEGSKRIADIKVGDEVYSENPETGETGYQKVARVFVVKTNTILTIKTKNETIETTKPHPFYVIGKGFVAAKDLQVGDHLKMANGEEAVIESLTLTHHDKPITVYNFEVENWHTYNVSGSEVLVHNISENPCAIAGQSGLKNADDLRAVDNKLFRSFDGHYEKHVIRQGEFGNITKEEYFAKAMELAITPSNKDILKKSLSGGREAIYNTTKNELVIVHNGAEIGTFFKPANGVNYFNNLK